MGQALIAAGVAGSFLLGGRRREERRWPRVYESFDDVEGSVCKLREGVPFTVAVPATKPTPNPPPTATATPTPTPTPSPTSAR